MDFGALWASGHWRKLGRVAAEQRFRSQIKTEEDWLSIQAARDVYNAYCVANRRWYKPMLGSVWFGRRKGWRDWIPDEFEAREDDKEPSLFKSQPHWCPMCEIPHSWDCQDHPLCGLSYEVACPEFTGSLGKKVGKCTPA
jgi:hypothetical protein